MAITIDTLKVYERLKNGKFETVAKIIFQPKLYKKHNCKYTKIQKDIHIDYLKG
ncbi:MAG: hypothetical protein HQK88_09680 [Nitrospirae bacterium]|nr:hypothetical protein [Nitrospirota bacterium]MBF0534442.1 hypothetical protein [Nitrospirota bacterium]MBF0617068.1 hypothetical protein [Nitrospirota bacterium]